MTARPARSRTPRLLLLGSAALALIAVPAALTVDDTHLGLAWQAALAKNDGGGQGNGGGQGGGNGGGHGGGKGGGHGTGQARGQGHGSGHGPGPDTATYDSIDQFRDAVRNGKAFGRGPDDARTQVPAGFTKHGSKGPKATDGFKNHGERTRTMVELAKRLGYSARVGALQANFGTPYENGIADLQDQLAAATAAGNQVEVERLEAELETAVAAAKPGKGPDDSWASADLDVNDDGTVDARDLDALDQQEAASADEPAS